MVDSNSPAGLFLVFSLNVTKLRRRPRKSKPTLVDTDVLFSPVLIKSVCVSVCVKRQEKQVENLKICYFTVLPEPFPRTPTKCLILLQTVTFVSGFPVGVLINSLLPGYRHLGLRGEMDVYRDGGRQRDRASWLSD